MSNPKPSDNKEIALCCAKLGLHVFPRGKNKVPLIKGWPERATTDAEQIKQWWTQWSDALPALLPTKSGIVVVDADRHDDGPDGVAAWDKLVADHGDTLNDVPTIATPNGGRHHYYKAPPGETVAYRSKDGIELIGGVHPVTAPLAMLPDGRIYADIPERPDLFCALRDDTLPILPNWVIELFSPPEPPPRPPQDEDNEPTSDERGEAFASEALAQLCDELARMPKNSGRNNKLYKSAFRMGTMIARDWILRSEVERALESAAKKAGLDLKAIRATLASGINDGITVPHEDLQNRSFNRYTRDDANSDKGDARQSDDPFVDAPPIQPEQPQPLIKSSKEFVADFVPPDYLVDGLLQEAFLYSLTGGTGAGKTSVTLRLAASVALGILFAGRETKKRRVLYLAAENPADVRMRWIALAQQMDFDRDTIEVYWVEGVFKISQMRDKLKAEAERRGGEFGLVIIDTGPVFYEGDEENNRTQQGRHAAMLRELIDVIPGKPAVLANVHPVKNAAADNLIPAGGGNFLNQVDGNLTAARSDNTTELHWQGKYRGVEFAPMHFMLRTVTHELLKDSRGRKIPTVVCDWISENAKEEIAKQKVNDEDRMLRFINDDPNASQATLATKMGWKLFSGEPHKTKVKRFIDGLIKQKLVKKTRTGNYRLTPEGQKVLDGEAK